jgi:hypothetical protein
VDILSNQCSGSIDNNIGFTTISGNTNNGSISKNNCPEIIDNSNGDSIIQNYVRGYILLNSNGGQISGNICETIDSNNSNPLSSIGVGTII